MENEMISKETAWLLFKSGFIMGTPIGTGIKVNELREYFEKAWELFPSYGRWLSENEIREIGK